MLTAGLQHGAGGGIASILKRPVHPALPVFWMSNMSVRNPIKVAIFTECSIYVKYIIVVHLSGYEGLFEAVALPGLL